MTKLEFQKFSANRKLVTILVAILIIVQGAKAIFEIG